MARLLSIGIVTPTVSRAGGGIFPIVLAHARELAARGHRVTVHGLDCDPGGIDRPAWDGLDLKLHTPGRFGYASRLLPELMAADHDILHQHGLWLYPSVAVSRWRAKTGRPTVISSQGMLEPWALSNAAWKKLLAGALFERHNVRHAGAVHCSAAEAPGIAAYAPGVLIAVIPNGAELPDLAALPPRTDGAKHRRTLLFFGRLHPKKGVAQLLRAFALVKAIDADLAPRWRLLVAGWDDGGHAASFKALARELGLSEDEVGFPGPRFGSEKTVLLASADAFVLPSFSEGFPIAVLEAWAHALPVLMTRQCNIPEGFDAGAAVEISNDPEVLAKQLAEVLKRNDLTTMGAAGRRLVETRFAWSAVATELAAVYQWLGRAGERPACVISV